MTRAQLLQRRASKAHQNEMIGRYRVLSTYNPMSASDHINRMINRISELSDSDDERTYYDRLIEMRRLHRDILAVAEYMAKNCPKDMIGYFKGKRDDALEGIARCNERIK